MYKWSNQCWQIHLLTTSALFPITSCLQTDYCCVCYCNCRTDNWSAWAKAPNSHQLHWAMGKGCRWTNFAQRICEIFTWTLSHLLFMLCNRSFTSYRYIFSSRLKILNHLINNFIANNFYIWMSNHIHMRLKQCEEQSSSKCLWQYKLIPKGCNNSEMFSIQGSVCKCSFSPLKKPLHGSFFWSRSSLKTDCAESWSTKCWNQQLNSPSHK